MKQKLVLASILFPMMLLAQTNDAQLWENIYIETDITQKFYAHFNHEGRITNNISQFNYGYGDIGLSYKLFKKDHLSLDYVFVIKNYENGKVSYRHQYYAANTFKKKINPFTLYWRIMYQVEYDDVNSTENGKNGDYYIRNKLTIKWKTPGRYIPYIASELYYNADNDRKFGQQFDRLRTYAGCFYELNKIDMLEAYYLLEKHFQVNDPATNWVIGLGYDHLFY